MSMPIRARLYISAHQGQVIMSMPIRARLLCQCPAGPGYMSVPSRARYQCPAGPTSRARLLRGWCGYLRVTASIDVVSVPYQSTNRAQISLTTLCQCPSGSGYYVSAHQGQVIMSVPIRVRLLCQCPSGSGYYVSAHQGQVIM